MKKSISFIIKALNEEAKIAKCIESCIRETQSYSSEVILVDSLSTDRTIEIAKQYPIDIVQFTNQEDVGCGAAAQLGYQCSIGQYIFFIDGDMELQPGFIKEALGYLESYERLAGVAGLVVDSQINTLADKRRSQLYSNISKPIRVSSLGGGGLYKRSAIEHVSYFAHSELKACEEMELGVRLRKEKYSLIRLAIPSVTHTGHNETNIQMRIRLWGNGRLSAYTSFMKTAVGKSWFWLSVRECWFVFVAPLSLVFFSMFLVLNISLIDIASLFLLFWVGVFLLLSIKKKSIISPCWSIVSWWMLFFASFSAIFSISRKARKGLSGRYLKKLKASLSE